MLSLPHGLPCQHRHVLSTCPVFQLNPNRAGHECVQHHGNQVFFGCPPQCMMNEGNMNKVMRLYT